MGTCVAVFEMHKRLVHLRQNIVTTIDTKCDLFVDGTTRWVVKQHMKVCAPCLCFCSR